VKFYTLTNKNYNTLNIKEFKHTRIIIYIYIGQFKNSSFVKDGAGKNLGKLLCSMRLGNGRHSKYKINFFIIGKLKQKLLKKKS